MPTPVRDASTVAADGRRDGPRLQGVVLRLAVNQVDERGEITEILDPAWRFDEAPIVYVYQSVVRPGRVKGWVVHRELVNMPSRPYDHANPDKYRLPLDSEQIPYRFDPGRGW